MDANFHLGQVLAYIADLHPDDSCRTIEKAVEFYNENNPHNQVKPCGFAPMRLLPEGSFFTPDWEKSDEENIANALWDILCPCIRQTPEDLDWYKVAAREALRTLTIGGKNDADGPPNSVD